MSDERTEVLKLANKLLDEPLADPDDDLRTLARQLMRREERLQAVELTTVGAFIQRGYELTVKWRPREERYHAFVDLGTTATSRNFMAASVRDALTGLEFYLKSTVDGGDEHG